LITIRETPNPFGADRVDQDTRSPLWYLSGQSPMRAPPTRKAFVYAGILGGVIVGAIIGNAIASHPGYYTYDDYGEYAGPNCYWARRAWRDQDGNVHCGRPRRFCN
jgi:hypothetical protein